MKPQSHKEIKALERSIQSILSIQKFISRLLRPLKPKRLQLGGLTSQPKNGKPKRQRSTLRLRKRIGGYLEAISSQYCEYSLIEALTIPKILCRRPNLCRLKIAIPFLAPCGAYSSTHSKRFESILIGLIERTYGEPMATSSGRGGK